MDQSKLYSPDNEQEQRERSAAHARQGRPGDYESEIIHKYGRRTPVRISGVPTMFPARKLIFQFIRATTAHGDTQEQS